MFAYWRDTKGRNETRVADAWWGTYSESNLSRIEVNLHYPFRGGLPNKANIAESLNKVEKDYREYKRSGPVRFIDLTVQMLQNRSRCDLDFMGRMRGEVSSNIFLSMSRSPSGSSEPTISPRLSPSTSPSGSSEPTNGP
jgi:hypothetical protein